MSVTPQTNCDLGTLASFLLARDDFVICGHQSPDGDCLGSQLALMHALRSLGKRATCVFATERPADDAFVFLPGYDGIAAAAGFAGPCGTFVSVDVQIGKRIRDALPLARKAPVRVSIDHHAADDCHADMNYVDPQAAATSQIVWELVARLGARRTVEIATCCYAGLMTDTGGFRFANTDPSCLAAAALMVQAGADPEDIANRVYQSRPLRALLLEALAVSRAEFPCGGELALAMLRAEDFELLGACYEDAGSVIDVLRSCEGVRVALVLRETAGSVRGSLRSKDGTDVSVIARHFGGGGHVPAAGFTVENATIDDCKDAILERVAAALHGDAPAPLPAAGDRAEAADDADAAIASPAETRAL